MPSPEPAASFLVLEKASDAIGAIPAETSVSAMVVGPLSGMLVVVAVGVALLMARKRVQSSAREGPTLV